MKDVPLLVLANKQDLPEAATAAQVSEKLALSDITDREFYISGCSALKSENSIKDSLNWLIDRMVAGPSSS